MTPIREAVILMAGEGSRLRQGYRGQARLRGDDNTLLKPFVPVLGRPLICYTVDLLLHARIKRANFVVGYQSNRMIAAVQELIPAELESSFIENREWQKQNGVSLLAAARHVTSPFLLAMGDHLFDNAMVDLLISSSDLGLLNIAVDRKLNSICDLDDAMKVQTRGNRIVAIGKNLRDYDAIEKTAPFAFDVGEGGSKVEELIGRLRWLSSMGVETVFGWVVGVDTIKPIEIMAREVIPAAAELRPAG